MSKGQSVELNQKVSIVMTDLAYQKIMYWVRKTTDEVSGFGMVEAREGKLYITDAFMLPQKNSMGSTDIEPEDVAAAMYDKRNVPGDIRFWWHSHGNGAVFWSSTDTDTIRKIGGEGWFISTVFNRHYERRTSFYQKQTLLNQPFEVFLDEIPLNIERFHSAEFMAEMDKEYDANVKKKWEYPNHTSGSHRSGHGGSITHLRNSSTETDTKADGTTKLIRCYKRWNFMRHVFTHQIVADMEGYVPPHLDFDTHPVSLEVAKLLDEKAKQSDSVLHTDDERREKKRAAEIIKICKGSDIFLGHGAESIKTLYKLNSSLGVKEKSKDLFKDTGDTELASDDAPTQEYREGDVSRVMDIFHCTETVSRAALSLYPGYFSDAAITYDMMEKLVERLSDAELATMYGHA